MPDPRNDKTDDPRKQPGQQADEQVTGLPPTPERLTKTGAPVDERFANRPADDREPPPPQPTVPQPARHFVVGGENPNAQTQEEDANRRTSKSQAPQRPAQGQPQQATRAKTKNENDDDADDKSQSKKRSR